jgi:renal tumor antigen
MDIWSIGCVMYEIMTLHPLFPGKNEVDQIHKIHHILGTPDAKILERFKAHATAIDFNFPE